MAQDPTTQTADVPTAPSRLARWFPIAVWLPKYKLSKYLSADLIAAISVAALLIPESMGYAAVAGVPIQLGLYAAPFALIGYAMFGGSRILVFAAAGSVAAMSASIVGSLSGGDQDTAIMLTVALAITSGLIFIVAGLTRMGWITNFMSTSVMGGFILGMAIQIIVGQFGKLFGIEVTGANTFSKVWSTITQFSDFNPTATVLGVSALALIFMMQHFVPKIPSALTAVIVSSLIVAWLSPGIDLVAKIPQGLPSFGLPTGIDSSLWGNLFAGGAIIALVGFSEGWGAETKIAKKTHDRLATNQEFIAYGVGNMGAGLLGGLPVAGSLSKSSAAEEAGAKSQMSNILLAVIVLLTLAFLAPAFQWLPETVLAAIVIHAMWGSANPNKLADLRKVSIVDFGLGLFTALMVLSFDLLPAMISGIVLSIVYLIYRVSFPMSSELGQVAATGDFQGLSWKAGRFGSPLDSPAHRVPGVMIFRFDAPVFFSNATSFRSSAEQMMIDAAEQGPLPHHLIIDCEEIFFVDVTGAESFTALAEYAKRYNVKLSLARLHRRARLHLKAMGSLDVIGEENTYHTVRDAVNAVVPDQRDASGSSK